MNGVGRTDRMNGEDDGNDARWPTTNVNLLLVYFLVVSSGMRWHLLVPLFVNGVYSIHVLKGCRLTPTIRGMCFNLGRFRDPVSDQAGHGGDEEAFAL